MMKRILIVLIAILSTFSVYSQDPSFGLKAGLNLTNFYNQEADEENSKIGYHLGLAGKFPFNDIMSYRQEIVYSTKGAKNDYNVLGFEGSTKLNLNYLEFPAMLQFDILGFLNVHGGLYGAYLLGNKFDTDGDFQSEGSIENDDFNRFDYGPLLGAAINIGLLEVGLRYSLGLRNVAGSNETEIFLGDSKNYMAQLWVSFGLR